MGVNLLSQSESTFGDEALSVEQPSEANPRPSASDPWGNLYPDQNTGQKPPIKSHNKVKQRLLWRGKGDRSPYKCNLSSGILLLLIKLSYFAYTIPFCTSTKTQA